MSKREQNPGVMCTALAGNATVGLTAGRCRYGRRGIGRVPAADVTPASPPWAGGATPDTTFLDLTLGKMAANSREISSDWVGYSGGIHGRWVCGMTGISKADGCSGDQ